MIRRLKQIGLVLLAALAVLIGIGVAATFVQGRATPSGRPEYVALGSSFAAGAGLGPLVKGSPMLCARSVNGYPQRLARMRDLSIIDMSCGGAVTKHLLRGGQFFQGPQVRVITPETRLVTITVGGNDVGYVGDLSLLAGRRSGGTFGGLLRLLWSGPEPMAERGFDRFEAKLSDTLADIRRRSPQVRIVVATYPTLLPPSGTCDAIGLGEQEADMMRAVGDALAEATRRAAAANGATVVDMHRLGADHHACSATPWTTGWKKAGAAPFHPTQAGARATADAVAAAVAEAH